MSARVVAVTALLSDVIRDLDPTDDLQPSEMALLELLHPSLVELHRINRLAIAEMNALAPALLAGLT